MSARCSLTFNNDSIPAVRRIIFCVLAVVLGTCVSAAGAVDKNDIRIAVIDFDSSATKDRKIGRQIADLLTAALADADGVSLIERSRLPLLLKEQNLSLSGFVDPAAAAKSGSLLGVKIVVTGRAYPVGADLWIAAKIVSTETARAKSVLARGPRKSGVGSLVDSLAAKIKKKLKTGARKIAAPVVDPDGRIERLRKRLARDRTPSTRVAVLAQVEGIYHGAAVLEWQYILKKMGYRVSANVSDAAAKWARAASTKETPMPALRQDSPGFIFVCGVSATFQKPTGQIIPCAAIADVTLLEVSTGRTILKATGQGRGADVRRSFAGRDAVSAAVVDAAEKLLPKFSAIHRARAAGKPD